MKKRQADFVRKYMRELRHALPINYPNQKKILHSIKQNLINYINENPYSDYSNLTNEFGTPMFRSFKAVKEKLDTRRGSHSELETAVKDLGKAVSYKGMYGDVAIVVYSGQYVENGVKKNFLPDNTMVLGNTHARGLRTYGCIQDADALSEGINASPRYPKNWKTSGDPAREFTMIQSAPLMLLADPDEFVSVQLAESWPFGAIFSLWRSP